MAYGDMAFLLIIGLLVGLLGIISLPESPADTSAMKIMAATCGLNETTKVKAGEV